jgi:hypothetical protein
MSLICCIHEVVSGNLTADSFNRIVFTDKLLSEDKEVECKALFDDLMEKNQAHINAYGYLKFDLEPSNNSFFVTHLSNYKINNTPVDPINRHPFVDFSRNVMNSLKTLVDFKANNKVKSIYVIFFHDQDEGLLYIFILNNIETFSLTTKDEKINKVNSDDIEGNIDLQKVAKQVDISRTRFGCKIDLELFIAGESSKDYVVKYGDKNKKVGAKDYFDNWTEFCIINKSTEITKSILSIMNNLDKSEVMNEFLEDQGISSQERKSETITTYKESIDKALNDNAGNVVLIENISNATFNNRELLLNLALEKNLPMTTELKIEKSVLNADKIIDLLRTKRLKVSVQKNLFQKIFVQIDEENETVSIKDKELLNVVKRILQDG